MVIGGWGGKNDDSEQHLKRKIYMEWAKIEQKKLSMNYDARLEMRLSNWNSMEEMEISLNLVE